MKWKREKEGREALHSKRRKREDFFWKREKERRRDSYSRQKKMEQRGRENVVPGTLLIDHEEEGGKMGKYRSLQFLILLIGLQKERKEDGKHRFLQFLVLLIGRRRERWKKGSIGSRFCYLGRHP